MPGMLEPPRSPAVVSPMCRSLHSTMENRNRPGGGSGAVKLYGPPVVSPKSEVPTALPLMSVNGVGGTGYPVRPRLVVVRLPRLEPVQLDVVIRRVARSDAGHPVQALRVGSPVDDAIGRRGLHPTEAVIGPRVAGVPGDDRPVLGERHQLEVHRRHGVACGWLPRRPRCRTGAERRAVRPRRRRSSAGSPVG